MERENKTKNRWAIKFGYDHKNPRDPSEKLRETMVGGIYWICRCWVWGGTKIVKVVVMMLMNWWEKDEMI